MRTTVKMLVFLPDSCQNIQITATENNALQQNYSIEMVVRLRPRNSISFLLPLDIWNFGKENQAKEASKSTKP